MPDFSKTLRSLFPVGQVFRFFAGSTFRLFIDSLAEMPERIITHADLVRDAGIPGYIPLDALSDWESFLNLMPDTALSTLQRQQRISGKMAKSGGQAWEYVQDVLQQAGFPVYVYENLENELSARVYTSALGNMQLGEVELGEFSGRIDPRSLTGHLIYGAPVWITLKNYTSALGNIELGEGQLGDYNGTETTVAEYTIPPTASRFIFIWFIAGPDGIHDIVDIPAERETDFRKLVESIKPVHTWCLAQVNFI
jgi:uncharacterized protein YmfQ (DUF2313 family)